MKSWRSPSLLTEGREKLCQKIGVVVNSGCGHVLDPRTHGGNEAEILRPPEETQRSRDLKTGGDRSTTSPPFVNAHKPDSEFDRELNDRRLAFVEGGDAHRREWPAQGYDIHPLGHDDWMSKKSASGNLVGYLKGRDDLDRKARDDVESVRATERDEGSRIDDQAFTFRRQTRPLRQRLRVRDC